MGEARNSANHPTMHKKSHPEKENHMVSKSIVLKLIYSGLMTGAYAHWTVREDFGLEV